jgi:Ca2+-binding RTX toxin-like protein
MAIVHGTESSETLDQWDGVTYGADRIYGYGGVDTIYALNGDDEIYGGEGDDWIYGQGNNDLLKGGGGADHLFGGTGTDWASYADAPGEVRASLMPGIGWSGGIAAGDTFDSIENLSGSIYNDFLAGDDGANVVAGQGGHDTLEGLGGADRLEGGTGFDTASYVFSPVGVFVSLISGLGSGGHAAGDTLVGIENLVGADEYDDVLVGNDGPNTLSGGFGGYDSLKGGGGVDTLYGGAEDDILDGGSDADVMYGGHNNDTYYVDNFSDDIIEHPSQGSDTVRASVSYALPADADVELLRTTDHNGTAPINLYGNASGNQIIGNNGPNTIYGGGGVDHMIGRFGNDTYYVDNTNDSVDEDPGQGSDTVYARVSWTLTSDADVETLAADDIFFDAPFNLTGNLSGNVIRGNNGNNTLNGREGNDELIGLGGQDWFLFDTALDAMWNVDTITNFSVVDDTIRLDDDIFSSGLTPDNSVASSQFVVGAEAAAPGHRIIYNNASGDVFYDSDGTGSTAAIRFARLSAGLADPTDLDPLTNFDFFVIA